MAWEGRLKGRAVVGQTTRAEGEREGEDQITICLEDAYPSSGAIRAGLPDEEPTTVGGGQYGPNEETWIYSIIGADWQNAKLSTNDVTIADFNNDDKLDIATAVDGAPNLTNVFTMLAAARASMSV